MIPFFKAYPIPVVGALQLQPFGLLVGTGVLAGAWLCKRRAKEVGISEKEIQDTIFWAVVPGFIMAHWWTVFLYHSDWLETKGWIVALQFWDGLSSFGGFLGALLGMAFYFRRIRKPWLLHAEIIMQGLILGLMLGRLGCTVVHDHPGRHSDFFLAVAFPGGPRHDLGLYEFLFLLLILLPASLILHARRARTGVILTMTMMLYAPVRFIFDFLRVEDGLDADARYLGLTPAQYGCIATFMGAILILRRLIGAPVATAMVDSAAVSRRTHS
jgi:phosphatidylglycerol---prolipoprotein diacylglyceryl transferase